MKKIAGVLSALLCVLLFSSFSPSLDGRAVVADEGVMPQGIFAKTVGYLPGDSISVTNLLTKSTVDILVIGALDPSEGVAILLSPESASLLGLEKGGNNVVKITKRSGQLDEQVSGTAVIGGGTYENPGETGEIEDEFETENESENESESVLESVEETVEPETEVLSDETEIPEEEISSEEIVETEEENETDLSSEEDEIPEESEEVLLPEEESVSGDEFDYSSGDSENDSDEDISERVEDDFVPEVVPEDEEAEKPSEPEDEDEKDDDESPLYESVSEDELPDVASAEPFEEDIYEIDEPEVTELSGTREDENEKEPLIEEPSSESVEAENLSELSEIEEETSETENSERFFEEPELEELENEEDFSAPEPENEDESEESYEPIILVPSDMNPPERLYSSQESLKESENEGENAENDVKTEIPESSGMNALNEPEENRTASESSKNSWEDKVLESEASLEKSKWYIQIAVLADFSNISSLVEKYGEDYPLVLVPSSNGKGYRILVGPLSVDEYGTVLNRFRSYGFKDAFLRKIK